jgi:hypothetical protein
MGLPTHALSKTKDGRVDIFPAPTEETLRTCVYRKLDSAVTVMKAADDRL